MVIDKHDYVAIELGHYVYYNSVRFRSYGSHKHKLSREYLWLYLWKYQKGLHIQMKMIVVSSMLLARNISTVSVCNVETNQNQ